MNITNRLDFLALLIQKMTSSQQIWATEIELQWRTKETLKLVPVNMGLSPYHFWNTLYGLRKLNLSELDQKKKKKSMVRSPKKNQNVQSIVKHVSGSIMIWGRWEIS